MQFIQTHFVRKRITTGLLAMALPLLFFGLAKSVWHSGDDAFVQYTLSGQLGLAPAAWWDYRYDWNALLGLPLATLYTYMPQIHWYFIFIFVLVAAGQYVLLRSLLLRFAPPAGYLIYGLLWAAHFVYILATPSYSITAFSVASCLGFAWAFGYRPVYLYMLFLVCLLLRWHMALPGFALSVGLSFLPRIMTHFKAVFMLILVVLLSYTAFMGHQWMAQKRDPFSAEVNAVREAYFAQINQPTRPFVPADTQWLAPHLQMQYTHAFFADAFWSQQHSFQYVGAKLRATKQAYTQNAHGSGYYLVRDYLRWMPAAFLIAFCACFSGQKKWIPILLNAALPLALAAILLYFAKLPTPLWNGLLLCSSLSVTGLMQKLEWKGHITWWAASFMVAIVLLGAINLFRLRAKNEHQNAAFLRAYAALPRERTVASSNFFPVDDLHVWQHPSAFPLHRFFSPFQAPSAQHALWRKKQSLSSLLRNDKSVRMVGPKPLFAPQDSLVAWPVNENGENPFGLWKIHQQRHP